MMKKIYSRLALVALIGLLLPLSALAQRQLVSGKVKDANGSPLPGVNVLLKGTTIGTTSDSDGAFSLEAAPTDVLVISFIGYRSEEMAVGAQTQVNVTLQEDVATLQE